jgi:hypothetical protein
MTEERPSENRYRALMPSIPGVPTERRGSARARLNVLAAAATILVVAGLAWGIHRQLHSRDGAVVASATAVAAVPVAPVSASSAPASALQAPAESGEIGALNELAKPWSSKAFTFVNPLTHETVPAMVVRLPGATQGKSGAYWAFSLIEPFGACQMLYVTNLGALASQYGYAANHPMVVDPCTQTVFDPLRMGQRADGAWLRGAIVQGGGLRPPIAIEVSVHGDSLRADRME